MTVDPYLSAARTAGELLRSPVLAERWDAPSALADFRISGLAGHLGRGVFSLEQYLAAELPQDVPPIDAVTYLATITTELGADPSAEGNTMVRDRGEADAAAGPQDLADRYDAAVARLAGTLPGLTGDLTVLMIGRFVVPLHECLITRMIELLVHADDLAVSLGVPTPDFDDRAADLVVGALAGAARRRHGTLPVLRALSRSERATAPISAF
jgi:uncharacterized protein (TIGR03083 family)